MLAIVSSVGYYGAYAYLVWRALLGEISIGTLTFLAGAIAGSSTQLQSVFSLFSHISDQALFLTDLIDFLSVQPGIQSKPGAVPAPRAIRDGFEFRDVSFHYPGFRASGTELAQPADRAGRASGSGRRERSGQDHAGEADGAALRSHGGRHPAGRRGPERPSRRTSPAPDRRNLSGFRPLRFAGASEHRRRTNRGYRA